MSYQASESGRKRYARLAARLRVPTGFVVAALFAALARPSPASLLAGLPLAFAGLALRAWAAGHLEKNQTLAATGPFAYTRNPLYLGTLTVAAGFALAARNLWLAVLFALYFGLAYLPAISEEESHLRQIFPGYEEYATQVPRLVPRLASAKPPGAFRWALYLRNREYQALLGYLAGAAWLLWRL
ncbi:MAG TPA: isoprenylcysteine carboxylmethyltransferase family protein [Bryobacterales bacterium]|nr:isoprenylcysteine carboxylmethyltransferase family protein [Bryobacterales bacterium]